MFQGAKSDFSLLVVYVPQVPFKECLQVYACLEKRMSPTRKDF